MFPLKISNAICIKLPLTLTFKILSIETFVFTWHIPRTGICHGTFEIVPQEVLWSIWGSHQTLWSLPLPNVTWHSGTWPYTMTPSIVQTLHLFANLLPNWTLIPILTSLPNFGGFHGTLQRVRLANRGRLLLRTPGPVPFGTCICSNVETILSWTCHVYGPFESRTSLGTSILLLIISTQNNMYARCSAYFSRRRHFALYLVVFASVKWRILRGCRKESNDFFFKYDYRDKINSISVSLINFFIAILYYN